MVNGGPGNVVVAIEVHIDDRVPVVVGHLMEHLVPENTCGVDDGVQPLEGVQGEEDLEEQSTSSGIGKGSGVKQASASDEEDPGKGKTHESVDAIQSELNEYKEAVVFLKDKLPNRGENVEELMKYVN